MNRTYATGEIKEFIASDLSIPLDKLVDHASLFHDLGVDGDDARDFLREFSCRFQVDMSQFVFSAHFGPEGAFNPVAFVCELLTKSRFKKFRRLEVRDLVQAAASGRLSSASEV
jgi:hypothetical protein